MWGCGGHTCAARRCPPPSAMRTLLLLWLTLAAAGAGLPCHDGKPCPATPVSAQGLGGGQGGCPHLTVGDTPPPFFPHSPPKVLPASSAVGCRDGSPCPTKVTCPLPEVSPPTLPQFPPPFLGHFGGGSPPPAALPPLPSSPHPPRKSPVLAATAAVPEGPTAALMANPAWCPQVPGGGGSHVGGGTWVGLGGAMGVPHPVPTLHSPPCCHLSRRTV